MWWLAHDFLWVMSFGVLQLGLALCEEFRSHNVLLKVFLANKHNKRYKELCEQLDDLSKKVQEVAGIDTNAKVTTIFDMLQRKEQDFTVRNGSRPAAVVACSVGAWPCVYVWQPPRGAHIADLTAGRMPRE